MHANGSHTTAFFFFFFWAARGKKKYHIPRLHDAHDQRDLSMHKNNAIRRKYGHSVKNYISD